MLVETAPMRTRLSKSIFMLAASMASFFSCADAIGRTAIWPDGFLSRVELLALIQTLNASLLASRSATATLENWCAAHKMAAEPKVIARRIYDAEKTPSEETRQRLRVEPNETVKYRHVQLACGDHILSEADNWYVPGRLSEDMNRLLETTETPFGKAVQSLQPFRRTIEMKMRWTPLPEGWELEALAPHPDGGGALQIPHEILEHRAILYTGDQMPFSEVRETYTSDVLDFEASPAPGQRK
jgi:chorismate-pyruvate lyase